VQISVKDVLENNPLPYWYEVTLDDPAELGGIGELIPYSKHFEQMPFERLMDYEFILDNIENNAEVIPYAAIMCLDWDYDFYKLDEMANLVSTFSWTLVLPVAKWFSSERDKFLKKYDVLSAGAKTHDSPFKEPLSKFGIKGALMDLVEHDPVRFEAAKKMPCKQIFDLFLHQKLVAEHYKAKPVK
jgi:hypothetical protein